MGHEKLIATVKKIMESEVELGEMARKAFNNTLTQKGKDEISAAVKKMIASDKEGKTNHADNFAFKALHFLAKQEVGKPVLTTDIQEKAGCKFPQPINKLLASLVASGYLERESSHVEPEPKEPGQRGRPKGPEKEKAEKPEKLGGLNLTKPSKKDDEVKNIAENEDNRLTRLNELEAELEENNINEEVNEESIESIEKKLVAQYGEDGNKSGVDEAGSLQHKKVDKKAVDKASTEYYEKGVEENKDEEEEMNENNPEPLNENFLTWQFRAGIITDAQLAEKKNKLTK